MSISLIEQGLSFSAYNNDLDTAVLTERAADFALLNFGLVICLFWWAWSAPIDIDPDSDG
jgi:hypothetical protein